MAPKFLCCLPLRFGVLVISFVQFILTVISAAFAWWFLWYADRHDLAQLNRQIKIALIVYGSIYSAAALLSFVGFLGACFKKLGAIRTYLVILYVTLGSQIGVAIYALWTYYRARNISGPTCILRSDSLNVAVDLCEEYRKIPEWAIIVAVIVPIVVEAYACYVVESYRIRLADQIRDKEFVDIKSSFTPIYAPVPHTEESQPLTHPTVPYPYTDQTHSFGHGGGHNQV